MTADILIIQESIRRSISDYAIKSKHKEEALVAMISVDIYLALEKLPTATPAQPKRKPQSEVINLGKEAERH